MPSSSSNIRIDSSRPSSGKHESNWFGLLQGSRDVVMPRIFLLGAVFILTVFGLVMVFSSSNVIAMDQGTSPQIYLVRQVEALLVALVCGFVLAKIPYSKWLDRALWAVLALSLALLFLTALIGTAGLGAQRWLVIGPINFQPSEFSKVVMILVGARIVYDVRMDRVTTFQLVLEVIVGIIVPLFCILRLQSDLGTTAICLAGLLAVAVVGNVSWRQIGIFVVVCVVIAFVAIFFTGYRMDRIMGLSGGNSDAAYQAQMAAQAFANGGVFGVGIGNSAMKYGTLPMGYTDFIYAIVGEECGFVGAFLVIALFCVIGWAGVRIAEQASDSFGSMIVAGCTVMLVVQAFLNIGCVLGIIPVTGKPLPFMSSGGSALIGSYLLVGTILSVSLNSGSDAHIYRMRRNSLRVITNPSRSDTGRGLGGNANAGRSASRPAQRPRPQRRSAGQRSSLRRTSSSRMNDSQISMRGASSSSSRTSNRTTRPRRRRKP